MVDTRTGKVSDVHGELLRWYSDNDSPTEPLAIEQFLQMESPPRWMSDRKEHNRTLTPPGNDGAAFTVIPTRVGMNISCNFVHYISQTCHFLDIGGGGGGQKRARATRTEDVGGGGRRVNPYVLPMD